VPAPRPQRHLPFSTYRCSSCSQGRGRSSSERSVRPTVPLKGVGANQQASEESGRNVLVCRIPLNNSQRPGPRVVSLSKFSYYRDVGKEPGAFIKDGVVCSPTNHPL
jgi:hypothetical protein